ncbi:MAG: hypothetical protein ABIK49_01575 [candidate division WOR-3 bacterium]
MKILAVATAFETQRFVKGYPPKGARLFLRPDSEISRLATLTINDTFVYLDERVEIVEPDSSFDLVLVRVDFNHDESARLIVEMFERTGKPVVLFGPQVTLWKETAPEWATHRVIGDITNVWGKIRSDAEKKCLQQVYISPPVPNYTTPHPALGKPMLMNTNYQTIYFIRGCFCPEDVKSLCPEFLYYQENRLKRSKEEILGEVLSLPKKHIHLLDDDIASEPDFYYEMFRLLWGYHRHWSVRCSERIFEFPDLVRLVAKAGAKVVFLDESFVGAKLQQALSDERVVRWLYRGVKFLQSRRLLVGTRLTLPVRGGSYDKIASLLRRIDLDFVEVRFFEVGRDGEKRVVPVRYHPGVEADEPARVKGEFYSFGALFDRFLRRPRRVGFYSTGWYLIPYSLAYRQNFLEGVPYP